MSFDRRSPEEAYSVLDEILSEILGFADVKITPKIDELLVEFNQELREALGLPVVLH